MPNTQPPEKIRLHIGGTEPRAGWKIFNAIAGEGVDFVGNCVDLSRFADDSIEEIYASHVYEHLGYHQEMPKALAEARRVLVPGGMIRIGVPDLEVLCRLFVQPHLTAQDRIEVMRMIYGGQNDPYDFHRIGLSEEFLTSMLEQAGFVAIRRVRDFGLFDDCTKTTALGRGISLNVEARKAGGWGDASDE